MSAAKHTDSRPKVACDECAERGECQVRHVQAHLYPADEALLAELQSDLGVSADEVVRLALHELAKRKRQD